MKACDLSHGSRLERPFFERSCDEVARGLIGNILCWGNTRGLIVETEAYGGMDDPASHAFRGPTPRSHLMFGPCGIFYVYLIYGMYHCLNVVAHTPGQAGAVLIRGLYLFHPQWLHLKGPGRLCRALSITRSQNGLSSLSHSTCFFQANFISVPIDATQRIGIRHGKDKTWRFSIPDPLIFSQNLRHNLS